MLSLAVFRGFGVPPEPLPERAQACRRRRAPATSSEVTQRQVRKIDRAASRHALRLPLRLPSTSLYDNAAGCRADLSSCVPPISSRPTPRSAVIASRTSGRVLDSGPEDGSSSCGFLVVSPVTRLPRSPYPFGLGRVVERHLSHRGRDVVGVLLRVGVAE